MKIIETLKDKSGFIFVILFFAVIFIIARMTAITPLSALEAWPEAEKIAKEKYPDARLTNVEANTYTTETRVIGESRTGYTYETIRYENQRPLHDNGTAEEWYFSFYSPSEKSIFLVTVVKRKTSKEIVGESSIQKVELPLAERIGRSEEEIEKKNKELQGYQERVIFDPKGWKIDSTEAIKIARSKVSGEFSPHRISLGKNGWGIWYWVPSPTEKGEGEQHTIWINATSGEIINQK